MVNSHLTSQQTEALAGLGGLQAAPGHRRGCGPGQPSTAGTRAGKAPGGAGRPARSGGGSATAPPSGLREGRRSRGQKAGTKARRQERRGGPKAGGEGTVRGVRPTKPSSAVPDPPRRLPPPHTQPGPHLWAFHGPLNLRFRDHRTHSAHFTSRGPSTPLSPPVPPSRGGGGQPVLLWTEALQPRSHRHPPAERLCPLAPP